jgi:head-tail adaptor
MRAGTLRHRVTFQAKTTNRDEFGDPQAAGLSWGAITGGTVWGEVSQRSGDEAEVADSIHPTATHTVRVRYSSALDAVGTSHRITFTKNSKAHVFGIVARDDLDHREREIVFTVKEETP